MRKTEQRVRSLIAAATGTGRQQSADPATKTGRGTFTDPAELRQRQRSMVNAMLCCMI